MIFNHFKDFIWLRSTHLIQVHGIFWKKSFSDLVRFKNTAEQWSPFRLKVFIWSFIVKRASRRDFAVSGDSEDSQSLISCYSFKRSNLKLIQLNVKCWIERSFRDFRIINDPIDLHKSVNYLNLDPFLSKNMNQTRFLTV